MPSTSSCIRASALTMIVLAVCAASEPEVRSPVVKSAGIRGVDWIPVAGNPLLTAGAPLSWRGVGAGDPALSIDPSGAATLWFTTVGISSDGSGGFVANGPYIGRASATLGSSPALTVDPEAPVVPVGTSGAWDRYVETPSVVPDPSGTRLLLWYLGYADKGGPTGFIAPAIGQMASTDLQGRTWNRPRRICNEG